MCVDFASLAIFCIILHNPFVCGRLAKAAAAAAVASAAAAATCGVYVTCNFIAFACFIHSLPPLLTSFLSASYSSFPFPPPPFTLSLPLLFTSPLQISSIIYAVFSFCQLKQSFIDSKRGRCEAKTLPALWGFVSSCGSIRSREGEEAHTHTHRCEQYEATLLL